MTLIRRKTKKIIVALIILITSVGIYSYL